ncbi:MAG: peptide chain release factor-like protein [Phycisphaeraceae bacterium]|nr:peptide chain release factor-like protein [Phycisphaeraceae bacterium]
MLRDCEVTHGRGSGPGGQRRNKVQTAVRIRHRPTGIEAAARERASQARNLSAALFRLRVKLALACRADRSLPSSTWNRRTAAGRIACNPRHADYPAMLAEALDHVTHHRGDVRRAAAALAVSSTQLLRFLATQPQALQQVNELRRKRGLGELKA